MSSFRQYGKAAETDHLTIIAKLCRKPTNIEELIQQKDFIGNLVQVSTKLNNNFDLTITAPSPATATQSATIVDNSTITTTNTRAMRMMGLAQRENNEIGAYQVVRCKINTHAYANAIAGV